MLILGMCGASYELILYIVYTLAKGEGRGGAGAHLPPKFIAYTLTHKLRSICKMNKNKLYITMAQFKLWKSVVSTPL